MQFIFVVVFLQVYYSGNFSQRIKILSAQAQWSKVNGSDNPNARGFYGLKGVPSSSNYPGARTRSGTWTTSASIWMFGGSGFDMSTGLLNDLWQFVPSQNQWIWKDGSRYLDQHGMYGTLRSHGTPGGRHGFVTWVDPKQEDALWMFGGYGFGDGCGIMECARYLNDIWRYREGEGWIWFDVDVSPATSSYGSYSGSVLFPGGRQYSATWTDKNGGLWLYGGEGYGEMGHGTINDLWRFDGEWELISMNSESNTPIFTGSAQSPGANCHAHFWQLSNGKVLLYGGGSSPPQYLPFATNNDFWEWDPSSANWRWLYGSQGEFTNGWRGAKGEPNTENLLGSRMSGNTAVDSQGSLWLFGGRKSPLPNPLTVYNDLWRYSEEDGWVWIAGSDKFNQPSNVHTPNEITPGGRYHHVMWIDNDDNLWIFGGHNGGNELWKYPLPIESKSVIVSDYFLIGVIVIGVFLVAGSVSVAIIIFVKKRRRKAKFSFDSVELETPSSKRTSLISKEQWNIPFQELEMETQIGKGGFGVVYKGKWRNNYVAIKMCQSLTSNNIEDFLREAELMVSLRPSPNVVQILGVCSEPGHFAIVLEYLSGGSLHEYLKNQTEPLSISMVVGLTNSIAIGMFHLHSENVIHRDLAARNILLTVSGTPKISDFGFSRVVEDGEGTTKNYVGPLKYMSPEAISNNSYSTQSDVWSFGIVVWEILTLKSPHDDLNMIDAASRIMKEGLHPPIPLETPEHIQQFLMDCWQIAPSQRPTFEQICDRIQSWNDESVTVSESPQLESPKVYQFSPN